MLLHAAGNMSMRSDGFNVADAVDIIVKARSSGARWAGAAASHGR